MDSGQATAPTAEPRRGISYRVRAEFEEPAIVIFGHALLIVFGLVVLSLLGWLIEHSFISETAKNIMHRLDEYLMVFAFGLLGLGFIIKIRVVVWGSILGDIGKRNE